MSETLRECCRGGDLEKLYAAVEARRYEPVVATARADYAEYSPLDTKMARLVRRRIVARNRPILVANHSFGYGFGGSITAGCAKMIRLVRTGRDGFIATWDVQNFYRSVRRDVVLRALHNLGLQVDDEEKLVINAWLRHSPAALPRGSAISYLLAEVVLLDVEKRVHETELSHVRFGDGGIVVGGSVVALQSYLAALSQSFTERGLQLSRSKTGNVTAMRDAVRPGLACGGYLITETSVRLSSTAVRQIFRATHHRHGALEAAWITKRWPLVTDTRQLAWIASVCERRYGLPQHLTDAYRHHIVQRSLGVRLGRGF